MVPSPKTTRWQMTVYEGQYDLLSTMPDDIAEWGWQDEVCPKSGRKHRQGYFRTQFQKTLFAMTKILPGIHIEPARDWNALVQYCLKLRTRDMSGSQVSQVNDRRFVKFHEALENIAKASKDFLSTIDASVQSVLVRDNKLCEEQYWYGVRKLLEDHKEDISLYSNPQLYRAWKGTAEFWLKNIDT